MAVNSTRANRGGGVASAMNVSVTPAASGQPTAGGVNQGNGADWFGPGNPLMPVAPPQVRGRSWDIEPARNLVPQPRAYELIDFPMLRGLAQAYDLLRTVIETRKDQMAALTWVPAAKKKGTKLTPEQQTRADKITAFFEEPQRGYDWDRWLRKLIEDLLVIDAATIYPRLTKGGDLCELRVFDGATIKVLVDDWGEIPEPPVPGYQQTLHGMSAVLYRSDELIYRPRNVRPGRVMGFSPVEQIVTIVNIAIRREVWQLNFFTEGNVPDMLLGTPDDWTPDQTRSFQDWWDSVQTSAAGGRRGARFVPGAVAKNVHETKTTELFGVAEEWLARVICFAFSISPQAFTKQVNRATAETQKEISIEEGLQPLKAWVASIINHVIKVYFDSPDLVLQWDEEEEIDQQTLSTMMQDEAKVGIRSIDEARQQLGLDALGGDFARPMAYSPTVGYVPIEVDEQISDQKKKIAAGITADPTEPPKAPVGPDGQPVQHGAPFGGPGGAATAGGGKTPAKGAKPAAQAGSGGKGAKNAKPAAKAAGVADGSDLGEPGGGAEPLGKATEPGLYVHRPLTADSAAEFIAWAKAAGFPSVTTADELHATVVYSRAPVDLEPEGGEITASGGSRIVKPLGDKGAVVLGFDSPLLTDRWQRAKDAGAAWDYPGYQPHVTITYDGEGVDLDAIEPFTGDLVFGPEVHAPLVEDWRPTEKYNPDQPRDERGRFGSGDDASRLTASAIEDRQQAFASKYGDAVAKEAGALAADWYTMRPTSHLDDYLKGKLADGPEKAAWAAVNEDTQARLAQDIEGDRVDLYRGIPGNEIADAVLAAKASGADAVTIPIHDSANHTHEAVCATGQHDLAANYAASRWARHGGDEAQAHTGVVLHMRVAKSDVVFATAHSAFTNPYTAGWNEYVVRTGGVSSLRIPMADVEVVGRAEKATPAHAGGGITLPVELDVRLHPEEGAPEPVAKYSDDQARDDHGRWTSGGSSDGPLSQELSDAAVSIANTLMPGGYDVSDTAPNTYEALVQSYGDKGRMTVWSGASDKTIFGDPKANYAFRAWHDMTHLRLAAHFTPEGEHAVCEAQSEDVRMLYGDSPEADHMIGLLHAEIDGQVQYAQAHEGAFPVDQRGFDQAWLADPKGAVDRVWKLAPAFDDYSWGRLRDTVAGNDGHNPSAAALALGRHLQAQHAAVLASAREALKYNADQERDERGRWTGTGATFVSPNTGDKTLAEAHSALSGDRQQVFEAASKDIDQRLGLKGSETPVLGAWKDGAENSVILTTKGADPEALRLSAAMKGSLADQKAVLVFSSNPKGEAVLYRGHASGEIDAIHQQLLDAGVENHSLAPTSGGAKVYVADLDGSGREAVHDFGAINGVHFSATRGDGEFIGATNYDGTSDAEQRAQGQAAYASVIANSDFTVDNGDSAGTVWGAVRDRWGAALAAAKAVWDGLGKYSPDQPRDSHGRFGEGDGASAEPVNIPVGDAGLGGHAPDTGPIADDKLSPYAAANKDRIASTLSRAGLHLRNVDSLSQDALKAGRINGRIDDEHPPYDIKPFATNWASVVPGELADRAASAMETLHGQGMDNLTGYLKDNVGVVIGQLDTMEARSTMAEVVSDESGGEKPVMILNTEAFDLGHCMQEGWNRGEYAPYALTAGADKQITTGDWKAGQETMTDIAILHETGHVLDYMSNRAMSSAFADAVVEAARGSTVDFGAGKFSYSDKDVQAWLGKNVSGYARASIYEGAAEAFSKIATGAALPPALDAWRDRVVDFAKDARTSSW